MHISCFSTSAELLNHCSLLHLTALNINFTVTPCINNIERYVHQLVIKSALNILHELHKTESLSLYNYLPFPTYSIIQDSRDDFKLQILY